MIKIKKKILIFLAKDYLNIVQNKKNNIFLLLQDYYISQDLLFYIIKRALQSYKI